MGVKVCCKMDFPSESVFAKLTHPKTDLSGQGNRWRTVEDLGSGMRVLWSELKIPFLADNDFCNGEYLGEHMGGLTYSFVAIEHPNCPPIKSKIRGEMRKGGWRVTPINATSCTVAFISVCDLKRSVPKSLALKGADGSAKCLSELRKMLRNDAKQ